jgi:MoaA/NifB/PqqE/SkfB family radical SAM enzyme
MTIEAWRKVIAAAVGLGITSVQFIGGEPTLHPGFTRLLEHAIDVGLRVEVFSNLVRVDRESWSLYGHPSVSLATSYYSDLAAEHETVTGRRGSHARTRANIAEAVRRQIPIRARDHRRAGRPACPAGPRGPVGPGGGADPH